MRKTARNVMSVVWALLLALGLQAQPAAAATLGAKPPRHVPRFVGRLLAGEAAAVMMTEIRGASNAKAKRELGWEPRHPSWRQGFAEVAA